MKKITLSLLFGFLSFFGFSQVGLVENFDAGLALPAGWTSDSGDYFGAVVQVCDGISQRANFDSSNLTGHLTSPNVVGDSNGSDLTITFDYKIVDWSAGTDATPPGWGEILVQYSTDDGGAWTTIGTINDINHATSPDCANISFVVPAANVPTGSDFKLRISNNYFSGNYYIYLDNISATQVVVDPPSCVNIITPANGATGVSINTGLEWTAATGIPTGYNLSVGTTTGGTELVDNENVGLSTTYTLPTLEYSTTYYVNISPFNANGPAQNCTEYTFTTGADPNAPVDCASGIPVNTQYCYTDNDTTTWNFQSSDGAPLVVFFNAGEMEGCCDTILIYDGIDNTGTLLYDGNEGGDLAGFSEIANSGNMYIEIDSDGSINCDSGFTPLDFDVSCVDESALPNCNANLTSPANGETDVDENADLTWSAASVLVTGYTLFMGTTPGGTDVLNGVDVGDVLTYDPGTLNYETTYYVTIVPYNDNGDAVNCNEQSFVTRDDPNQVLDCSAGEVINTVYCYDNNDPMVFNYASNDGSPISLVFNEGQIEAGWDEIIVTDSDGSVIFQGDNGGDLAGLSFTSSGSSIALSIDADGSGSCQSSGYTPWDITVSCVDTTALPNCDAALTLPVDGAVGVDEDEDLTWSAATVLVTGYTLYMGTTPGGTDVLDGVDVGDVLTYDPGTLAYETTYYVTIVPYNDNGDATGCTEESFTTRPDPNQVVDCDAGQVVNTVHCYENGNNQYVEIYSYVSSNGDPLNIFFHSGTIETCCDTIRIEEGDGTVIYEGTGDAAGNLAGLSFNSTGDTIVVFVEADGSVSCESGADEEWNFDVSCIDTTAVPNCNASLTSPFDGEVDVNENEDLTWSAASVVVTGYTLYVGTTPGGTDVLDGVDVGDVLTYDPGTLEYGTTYYVTIIPYNDNGDATGCTEESFTIRPDPNVIVDCDGQAVNTTYCYTNNDPMEFYFASSTGFPLVLDFNAGEIEDGWDEIIILDSDGSILYQGDNGGDLTGLSFTTSGDTLTIQIDSDGSGSCTSSGYIPWDFDVYCQTCLPQTVSFDVVNGDCITDPNNPVFEVEVDVTDMGDATSLTITDNQGSDAVEVLAAETIVLGPYPASTNVIVTVANTNDDNCVIVSNPMAFLCPPPPNPCSIVFAGDDQTIDCENPDAVLTANFHLYGQDTENYEINAIDTCPTPPVDGATPTSIETDDVWSEVIDLGFEFCFYGGVYDQVIVGSNGVISFETEFANTGNGWDLQPFGEGPSTLPNTTNATITEANIFGVGHDIDPSVCGSIDYVILGSAPYRQFVVNYNAVCHFGSQCNSNESTSQIILHESSNNIDIHVISKPTCTGWNDGLAVIGLQSVDDTQATTPVGRNTGVWTVDQPESWRFSPSGTPNYTLEWLDEDGNSIGNTETVTVSPGESETYTFEVTYDLCTGGQATVSDEVLVEYTGGDGFDASFTMDATCDGGTATITGDIGGTFELDPAPTDNAVIDPDTGEVTGGTPGSTYTVQYTTDGNCPAIETFDLTTLGGDATFIMDPTCDGATATIVGDTGGTFTFDPAPIDTAIIDPDTGEVTGGTPGETYTVVYTLADGCSTSSIQMVTALSGADASFTMTPTCDGGTATITGDAGGTFAFNPDLGDGATIDMTTGEVIDGVPGTTYTIEYTVIGSCTVVETQTLMVPAVEDASFTMEATCDGATATITGNAGGTFVFNPVPTDTAVIDTDTGEVTGGTPGTSYTVEYTTGGGCPEVSSQTFTVLPVEDASFTVTATCDGATATITGNAGGTFAFNPAPTDTAVIDPDTGEVTGGTPGTIYTVEYTTGGSCPEVSSQTFTVLPQDDASFTLTVTCDGATATITGDSGGTFTITSNATIDPATGTVTDVNSGETYTVEYTTNGTCPATSTQEFTVSDAHFEMETVCGGAVATILGDENGSFTISPNDGVQIDSDTGEVTEANGGTTYTIMYTTPDGCSSTVTIQPENCIIPEVITPNDDGYNDSFDLSGYSVTSLEVFNRNGIKVYSKTNGYTDEFRGIADNGDELPVGTYYYVMKYQGNNVRTSWLYITK